MLICVSEEKDYAVIKINSPQMASISKRISISYTIAAKMPIRAFGFPGHIHGQAIVINGEITVITCHKFKLSLPSASELSGTAIITDEMGHAVGYLGRPLDASNTNNSQLQSFAFKFDEVATRTHRDETPYMFLKKATKKPQGSSRRNVKSLRTSSSVAKAKFVPVIKHHYHTRSKSAKRSSG
mmetsp:Transcript_22044/g.31664  ORF Transcript_22044/g.31664 Transcript_22044/m.31664 type:complete len:183 (-) Transcript_22044:126-674(-)